MIKEVAQYIENNTGFKIGKDLFPGFRPHNAPKTNVAVLETDPGIPSPYLLDYVDYSIQILSSGCSYWQARENAWEVYTILHGKVQITLPVVTSGEEYLANFIEAENTPQSIGQGQSGVWEFSTNFTFRIQNA